MPGDQMFIWTSLVPRLVHPTKMAIINVLLEARRPLSADDLIPLLPAVDSNIDLIRYHLRSMVSSGALEVASHEINVTVDTPQFDFPRPA